MYQKLSFFPSEMIFYEFDGSYIEHVRYDPFLLSESEPKPGTDSLFPGQTRPFAFELHTAIARYEAVIDEAAAIATACMKNLNLILPTTYAIADVILSSKKFGSIIAAKYNLFYVKHYLASLDGKYKSFPDKYLSFLDHILQTTGTIFTYQPYSMAFSFEYDSAIPVYAFSIPVDAIDTPVFKTGAYNVRADPAPAPKDHFSDEDISALFPFPKYAEPQPAQPIVAYTTYKEKKGKNGETEKKVIHPISARLYPVENLWQYIRATLDYSARHCIRLRQCIRCGRYYTTSDAQYCGDHCKHVAKKKIKKYLPMADEISQRIKSMLTSRIEGFKPASGNWDQYYKDYQALYDFRADNTEKRHLYSKNQYCKDDYFEWLEEQHKANLLHPENSSLKKTKNNS